MNPAARPANSRSVPHRETRERNPMNAKALIGAVSLLVCATAAADGPRNTIPGVDRSPAAMLYLEFPVAAKHHERPAFGFRMERIGVTGPTRFGTELRSQKLMDVRLNRKEDDPRSQALDANGLSGHPGAIAGIVIGAVAVVAAISGGSDGGGGY